MSLVEHAKRELQLCGQFDEDPAYAQSIVAAVAALSSYGHSGGSMAVAIAQINDLLQLKPLSSLTSDPEKWMAVSEQLWQSRRDPSVFSKDGGKTWG